MSGAPAVGTRGRRCTIGALVALGALGTLVLGVGGALAVEVNVTSPPSGTWVRGNSVAVAGTAGNATTHLVAVDGDAAFAAGSSVGTVASGGDLAQALPGLETWSYFQDFSGQSSSSTYIDPFWTFNHRNQPHLWFVDETGAYTTTPPALYHGSTGADTISWSGFFPGAVVFATIGFNYSCASGANLYVDLSKTGFGADETRILSATNTGGQRTLSYNATSTLRGGTSAYIRIVGTAGTPAVCMIDEFSVSAQFVPARGTTSAWYNDSFDLGRISVWTSYGTVSFGDLAPVSDSPPSLVFGTRSWFLSHARADWGFATPIRSATVRFHYQCELRGVAYAWIGQDGVVETPIVEGARSASHTAVVFNATAALAGGRSAVLHLAALSTNDTGDNRCGFDNVSVEFTFDASQHPPYAATWTSAPMDLGSLVEVVTVAWAADVPPDTRLSVLAAFSSDNVSFSGFQTIGQPGERPGVPPARYVVLRVRFDSLGGFESATLDWVGVTVRGLARVEWSLDGGPRTLATGTVNWNATVAMGTGAHTLRLRATDSSGASATATIFVGRDGDVPTVPGALTAPALTNQSTVRWSWNPSTDGGSGIAYYLVDVGSVVNGTNLVSGARAAGPSFTLAGVAHGGTYYARVRSVDGVGFVSAYSGSSAGTSVDYELPAAPTNLMAGEGFTRLTTATWTWQAAQDSGAGTDHYLVTVTGREGEALVLDFATSDTEYTVSVLAEGQSYIASVRAVDAAGNIGPPAVAVALTVDATPPGAPELAAEPPARTKSTVFVFGWLAAADAGSGVAHYVVQLGTVAGGNDTFVGTTADVSIRIASLAPGHSYFLTLAAIDRAGNVGAAVRVGPYLIDATSPGAPELAAVPPFVGADTFTLSWEAPEDGPAGNASGISHYLVEVVEGGRGLGPKRVTGTQLEIAVVEGLTYAVAVRAVDAAGNIGAATDAVFVVDTVGPAAPRSVAARVTDVAAGRVRVSWTPATDATAGVRGYRVAVGTPAGPDDVHEWIEVNASEYFFNGSTGLTYYVTVVAIDEAGNEGATGSAVVTLTPPAAVSSGAAQLATFAMAAGALAAAGVGAGVVVVRRRVGRARDGEPAGKVSPAQAPAAPAAAKDVAHAPQVSPPPEPAQAAAEPSPELAAPAPCPGCGSPLDIGAPTCERCRMALEWG